MAKRHPGLVPLARDHHNGLLLAVRLQQGKKALLRLWSHDPGWQAATVVEFFDTHLHRHFEAEEKALFPLALSLPQCSAMVQELVSQHRKLEAYVKRLQLSDSDTRESDLQSFGALLEEHVRKEDRVLFPLFEEHATKAMLHKAETGIAQFYARGVS